LKMHLPSFKKLGVKECKIVVFNYSCCKVVGGCHEHPEARVQ
jgi:hypothetical protein